MITWWTIAEDRNEIRGQHRNLRDSFVLINAAFFVSLFRECEHDKELIETIENAHRGSSEEVGKFAENLVKFLSEKLTHQISGIWLKFSVCRVLELKVSI